jgi:hypothetical protein
MAIGERERERKRDLLSSAAEICIIKTLYPVCWSYEKKKKKEDDHDHDDDEEDPCRFDWIFDVRTKYALSPPPPVLLIIIIITYFSNGSASEDKRRRRYNQQNKI